MKWSQLDLSPAPRDWWAHPLPDYVARGDFDPIDIGDPPPLPPELCVAQATVRGRVTHEEVVAMREADARGASVEELFAMARGEK